MRKEWWAALVLVAGVSWLAPHAHAEDDPPAQAAPSAPTADSASPPAPSAAAPRHAGLEEIIVTAQKREQTLQEVPISVSVVSTEFMKETSITDFRDLSLYVPGVSIDNTAGNFVDIRIRGFGSPISNKAFEQSVGLVVDGIPYTRLQYWQSPLFDLERVEVLRGPQGTLFGKNTTAGLFNVVTKKPTDEYTGYVEAELGELADRHLESAIGGPIIRNFLNFRIAGIDESRNGFIENTTALTNPTAHSPMNSRDRKGVRAQLNFPDLLGVNLNLGYEQSRSETNGTGWNLRIVDPNQIPFFRYWDPNVNLKPDNWKGSTNSDDFTRADITTLVANASYDLRGWGLNLVSGYSVIKQRYALDEDFTPAPYADPVSEKDKNPQTVVEVRATSPDLPGLFGLERLLVPLGHSDLTVGFFYDHRSIEDSRLDFPVNFPVLAQLEATSATGIVPPCPGCQGLGDIETLLFGQQSTSFAPYSQLNWHPAQRWTLEYGMRFTHESKSADWDVFCSKSPDLCAGFQALLHAQTYTAHHSLSESAFTPKVTLRYDLTDDTDFYVGWGKGFKSGGFSATRFENDIPFSFRPEKATSWEVGTKMGFFDRSVLLNVSLFRQEMTDLQVFVVTPQTQLIVVNAGESRSQGVETDLTWIPTEWLTVHDSFNFIDTKYLSFPEGPCAFDKPGPGPPPFGGPCDLSGRVFEFTPRWTNTLTPSVRYPFASIPVLRALPPFSFPGIDLIGGVTLEYKDNYYAEQTLDPRTRQPAFIRLGGNVGVGNANQGWSVKLVGTNLTNEAIAVHVRDISLVGKSFVQVLDPPRLLFGEFRWAF